MSDSKFEQDERVSIRNITLNAENCTSFGDAMRELASDAVIRGPFVLVTGDIVSNMNLRGAMEAHQANKAVNKEALMTCVFKKVVPNHPTRSVEDDVIVCLKPDTSQLLSLQSANSRRFSYEVKFFDCHDVVDFRYDLMNTSVTLCEPHVPERFADHFDTQDMCSFIKGIINEEEMCSETIFVHELEQNSYAARVSNLRTYAAVSHDIMHRWTYPVVPDNNSPPEEQYIYRRRGIYLPNSVRPYKAKIHQNTIVGSETTIDRNAEIADSVIGRKCEIGANVKITNSYIWDEVTIKNDCVIDSAVLCSGATIKSNTTVTPGCILSYDTVVGPNTTLKTGTRVTVAPSHIRNDSECSNDSEETRCSDLDLSSDTDLLGADSWGKLYQSEEEDEESDSEIVEVSHDHRLWYLRHTDLTDDNMSDSSDSTPVPSEPENDAEMGFYAEVCDSFRAGYAIQKDIDNILIEVNASKHAYNVSVSDQLMHSTRALLELCPDTKDFQKYAQYFAPMFIKLAKDRISQMVILDEIETWALDQSKINEMQKILHILYNEDVLDEVNILDWSNTCTDSSVIDNISKFINWLQEAEEESSEEESD